MTRVAPVIGFIGLGAMGGGMSRNVATKHDGTVYAFDLNADALAATVAAGALAAGSVADLAAKCDIILLSLPGGKQVRAVADEIAAHAKTGLTVVDLSTTSVGDARDVHASLAKKGIEFADAPVARAVAAANAGTLSIMAGATEELFAKIAPVLSYMGTDVNRCGEVGCGQVVKLVNNMLLFEHVAALAEMMVVSERAGVTPKTLLDVLSISSADSFALRNHGMKAMLPRAFPEKTFPSDYVLKDADYALDLAASFGVDAKMATLARSYYAEAVDTGIGAKYYPVIIDLIDKK